MLDRFSRLRSVTTGSALGAMAASVVPRCFSTSPAEVGVVCCVCVVVEVVLVAAARFHYTVDMITKLNCRVNTRCFPSVRCCKKIGSSAQIGSVGAAFRSGSSVFQCSRPFFEVGIFGVPPMGQFVY